MATDKKIKTKEELAADEELEDLFQDFDGTLQVKLERLEPSYAEGYCGKFNVTAGRPLTAHEIKTRFGGRVFRMVARDSGGKYVKKKIISISGLPKDEGRVINVDGTLAPEGATEQTKKTPFGGGMDAWEALLSLPLTVEAKKALAPHLLGWGGDEQKPERKEASTNMMEMMAMQQMMDWQQKMRSEQMRQEKMSQEMERDNWQWRREIAEMSKPKDTLSGMNDLVKVFKEMNGLRDQLSAPGSEPIANTLISSTMPMIETMMAEFMQIQKMKIQMMMNQEGGLQQQNTAPPELPQRTSTHATPNTSQLRVVDDIDDAEAIARKFGSAYKKMSPEEQRRMMNAFFQGEQNIESNPYNDTIEDGDDDDDDDMLDPEDQEILDDDRNEQNENSQLSNGGHTRPADDNDPDHRQGNQGGGAVSAH